MNDSYQSAWDGYRYWRFVFWVSLPILGCLVFFGAFWLFWIPPLIVCSLALTETECFRCPRCKGYFFFKGKFQRGDEIFYGLPSRKCVHCGLPKWVNPPKKIPSSPTPHETTARTTLANMESIRLKSFLTLVIRDDPYAIGLKLDSEGWADVEYLLARAQRYGIKLTREDLENAVGMENSLFEWDQASNRIRVCR